MQSLVELLSCQAQRLGDKRAFSFVRDGRGDVADLTYAQLHRRARAFARRLQAHLAPGDRALLLYPPGLDFITGFFGCLYAGVIAVPVSPPRRRQASSSLRNICQACQPAAVLSTAAQAEQAPELYADLPSLIEQPWIASDAVSDELESSWQEPAVGAETVAFLQFTSGSTAEPKGVMLSHSNLLHNLSLIGESFGNTEHSSAVFWLPLYHDMGLIGGVLQPIYCGGYCTLMAPATFLQRPRLWLETISQRRATISGGPDFAYELCARKISPAEREGLDLSCWELAFTGAEPIRAATLDEFTAAFAPCGFRRQAFFPCYGLAEATLMVCGGPRGAVPEVVSADRDALALHCVQPAGENARACRLVASGPALGGQQVVVVPPGSSTACGEEQVGEIWIHGPSVAQGYWDQPEATDHTFAARLSGDGDRRFLRTGDLGFLKDGRLFVSGRLKDLIIIRGRNYYPADIERTVEQAHPVFRTGHAAAFSVEQEGHERLVVVQEIEPRRRDFDARVALEAIRTAVADEHDLELHAVLLTLAGSIPKTTSGKTRRTLCRGLYLGGELQAIAAWQSEPAPEADPLPAAAPLATSAAEIEAWLLARIAARLPLAAGDLRTRPFLDFGLGSLEAVQMIGDLERWLGRRVPPTAVYNHPNIAALAEYLAGDSQQVCPPARANPQLEELASGQQLLSSIRSATEEELQALIERELQRQAAV